MENNPKHNIKCSADHAAYHVSFQLFQDFLLNFLCFFNIKMENIWYIYILNLMTFLNDFCNFEAEEKIL